MGDTRWEAGFPWNDLLSRGAKLAFASDWPVADLNPFVHLKSAVTRVDRAGNASPHRLTVREAIDAYTQGGAHATGCESDRGTLAPGKRCDLVVLSENPFETPGDRLDGVRVVVTMVDGRTVYRDPASIDTAGPSSPAVSG